MRAGPGLTRRGLMEAGGAGAAALGLAACGDDYFAANDEAQERRPEHAPDRHRFHARGLHRRVQPGVPQQDAEPGRAGAGFAPLRPRGARGHAHRPGPARPAHRPALVSLPQLGAHQGPASGAGLDPDPGRAADRDRGDGRGRRGDRLLHGQPLPRGTALRELPPDPRLRPPELLPGRVPLPEQAVQAPGSAERDRALPAAQAEQLPGGGPPALACGVEQHLPRTTSASTRRRG